MSEYLAQEFNYRVDMYVYIVYVYLRHTYHLYSRSMDLA